MKRILTTTMLCTFISACANNYSCGQFPDSGCQPVSAVYERTNNGFNDYRKQLYLDKNGKKNQDSGEINITVNKTAKALNHSVPGDPILTKPVVMRILFNSWQDSEKDLNTGGYVYVKLRDSQWVVKE